MISSHTNTRFVTLSLTIAVVNTAFAAFIGPLAVRAYDLLATPVPCRCHSLTRLFTQEKRADGTDCVGFCTMICGSFFQTLFRRLNAVSLSEPPGFPGHDSPFVLVSYPPNRSAPDRAVTVRRMRTDTAGCTSVKNLGPRDREYLATVTAGSMSLDGRCRCRGRIGGEKTESWSRDGLAVGRRRRHCTWL